MGAMYPEDRSVVFLRNAGVEYELYGITHKKIALFLFTAMRTSNLT
jgi:hypothetical protein